jgi:hypothetical protein
MECKKPTFIFKPFVITLNSVWLLPPVFFLLGRFLDLVRSGHLEFATAVLTRNDFSLLSVSGQAKFDAANRTFSHFDTSNFYNLVKHFMKSENGREASKIGLITEPSIFVL